MKSRDDFKVIREVPFEELVTQLRSICLLNRPALHPYENAKISIERMSPDNFSPTSKYVLSRQLATLRAIRDLIKPEFDPMELKVPV